MLDVSDFGLRALPLSLLQVLAETPLAGGLPHSHGGHRAPQPHAASGRHSSHNGGGLRDERGAVSQSRAPWADSRDAPAAPAASALSAVLELRCARCALGDGSSAVPMAVQHGLSELLPQMQALRAVDLSECQLSSLAAFGALRALPLSSLLLGKNCLRADGVEQLLELPWRQDAATQQRAAPGCAVDGGGAYPLWESLGHLDLSSNRLESLPATLLALPRLHTLSLAHNALRSLRGCWPPEMAHSPPRALANLDLSSNRISDLAELPYALLAAGPAIRSLSLESNELAVLPPALGKLTSLHALLVAANPQKGVRSAVLDKGTAALLAFLRDRADDGRSSGAGSVASARRESPAHAELVRPMPTVGATGSSVGGLSERANGETAGAHPADAPDPDSLDRSVQELRRAHALLLAQLDGTAGPTLSEARRFAVKKEAAKAKAELIRMERVRGVRT